MGHSQVTRWNIVIITPPFGVSSPSSLGKVVIPIVFSIFGSSCSIYICHIIMDISEVIWLIKVYRRPYVVIVKYRLLHSLASIKGYIEVLVTRYYYYASRRNVIRLEGYYLVLRPDTSQDLRPNLPTRFCTLASFSLASPLGSILCHIPILYPLELLVEALD